VYGARQPVFAIVTFEVPFLPLQKQEKSENHKVAKHSLEHPGNFQVKKK